MVSESGEPTTPEGWDVVEALDWVKLPYGCFGLARHTGTFRSGTAWSWLILVPWSAPTTKPWVDGSLVIEGRPLPSPEEQYRQVLDHMRGILDDLYGESVGEAAVDQLLREMGIEDEDPNAD